MSKRDKTVRVALTQNDLMEIKAALNALFLQRLEEAGGFEEYRKIYGLKGSDRLFTEVDIKIADATDRLITTK